jgi:hypothetical protein
VGVVFAINLKDRDDYPFFGGLSFFGNGIGDPLRDLAFLLDRAAF